MLKTNSCKGVAFALALFFTFCHHTFAQVTLTNLNNAYTQDFNTLPKSGTSNTFTNNSTLTGWYAAKTGGSGSSMAIKVANGSSTSTSLYSFGTTNATDRALGSIGAGGTSFAWGLRLKNNSGQTIQSVQVTFTGEQWRVSTSLREQLASLSYLVSGSAITTFSCDETGYAKVPFLNFVSPVFDGQNNQLDGNASANRQTVVCRFNVTIPNGSELMLKWYDRDDSQVDHALSIDDVTVQAFTAATATDQYTGGATLSQFMKGVILDLPDEGSGVAFSLPSGSQEVTWQTAMQQIVRAQYGAAYTTLGTNSLGYRLTSFVENISGRTYYVVSKDGNSGNHWGVYVFSPNAGRRCVSLQAPHPMHDRFTGEEATYLFRELDAYSLMIAGGHRCLSATPSNCAGSSGPCRADGKYTISDMAHVVTSVFQVTTAVVADSFANARFIQLHGFGQGTGEPYFIISNGTRQTPTDDYVAELGSYLESVPVNSITPVPDSAWNYKAPHLDTDWNTLIATTNVQGRYLNNYANGDICTSNTTSTTVTSRFLHIEQYGAMRENAANYPIMRDALLANGICSCPASRPAGAREDNPVENMVQVRYDATNSSLIGYLNSALPSVQVMVISMTGQVLSELSVPAAGEAYFPIETSRLPKGIYFLRAQFGATQQTVKFVVE